MDEESVARTLLPFAINVARKMTRDPEADSIAGWAMLRAIRSFDEAKCSIEGYVAYCVRTDVKHYWRKCNVRKSVSAQTPEEYDEFNVSCEDSYVEDLLTELEWRILIQRFELRWPLDVVAKRNNMTKNQVRRITDEASWKLEAVL